MVNNSENVGIAFAAVFAAGGATAVGAAVVFFPKLVKLASRRVLAASLGFSAGVMTYVSFVEIFQKSVDAFTDHADGQGYDEAKAGSRGYVFATLSFFGGIAVMIGVDFLVDKLSNENSHGHSHDIDFVTDPHDRAHDSRELKIPHCLGCVDDPVAELDSWQGHASREIEAEDTRLENQTAFESRNSTMDERKRQKESSSGMANFSEDGQELEPKIKMDTSSVAASDAVEKAKLQNMGMQTAIAIALHNFPEGLATYVAVLEEPKVGLILAIAIAIHNIPEGLCVSLPVYYATGNRPKAFLWGALSGITEPIGAFFGWLIFAKSFSDMVYGLMFGLVGGMMVMISFRELLPTANKFDPKDTVVSYSAVTGMLVMAISLIFNYI